MNKRAPWALSLYFTCFLVLLVWGRFPEEPSVCANAGLRLLSPGTQQFISEYQASPFCPACGGPSQRAAKGAPALAQLANTFSDGKNSGAPAALPLPRYAYHVACADSVKASLSLLPDTRLVSLRTVVLLN
ncbi:hypothetical protein SAMN05660860_03053 [Geoalkalibacter ferrihydriticus]|uniref:Uncharacterized protein n=2 Tax=Geoalkalibacter ferrihydriticus TaxID=392333 RepID=A0A0C2HFH8_9BACT|nr:hypothetical protein [Geoalkalibacter ferrihydriticus]KIH75666.1 hypothetical protein GFER_15150 [Geoalkalibacter ferrihydriticus DSM 17813]SDM72377.1 hypothetical protein SAMN05660860_03053 [Geoalkalibacter ferrihydriticus]